MPEESLLSQAVCERIVSLVHGATGHGVNVMGSGGRIIASSDPARIGTLHEGARRIMAGELDEIAIDPATAESMKGVRPGYNGAVRFDGRLFACIGISGDPAVAKPLQKMAELVMRHELERERLGKRESGIYDGVRRDIGDIAERMEVLSLNGSVIAARLGEKGRGFKIVVAEMRRLASQIGDKLKELESRGSGL